MTCARATLLALVLSINVVLADPPTLEVIYPPGAQRGSTNTITLSGKFEPWPAKVWVSAPGLDFAAQTNKGKFDLIVATNAEPGPRLVRLYNDEGASEPRFFVVGADREINDSESNNHFAKAQAVGQLPVTINGRLDKSGDVDSFAISLRAGQWLDARVDSHTLMSKLDAVLRLVTTNGHQVAWNHDFATFDPRVLWAAINDETLVLQLYGFPYPATSDVKLYGGDSAIYRLHLSVRNDPPEGCPHPQHVSTNLFQPPVTIHGTIRESNEEGRFGFAATENETIQFKVAAAVSGSPLDAWLAIRDATGKELARNDDAEGKRDPSLEWKPPTNGTFNIVVGSLTHRGGPDYHYCLTLDRAVPDFRASRSASSLVVKPDSTNSIKFNVKRLHGHTNELAATLKGLPDGVSVVATNVPASGGDVSLQVFTATDAAPFAGPIRLVLTDMTSKSERVVAFPLTSRTEDNGVPGGYSDLLIDTVDHLWLTVRAKAEEAGK